MSQANYRVEFRGPEPDQLKVGDTVLVSGTATVSEITADLVDITAYGNDPEVIIGEITINLYANRFEIRKANSTMQSSDPKNSTRAFSSQARARLEPPGS